MVLAFAPKIGIENTSRLCIIHLVDDWFWQKQFHTRRTHTLHAKQMTNPIIYTEEHKNCDLCLPSTSFRRRIDMHARYVQSKLLYNTIHHLLIIISNGMTKVLLNKTHVYSFIWHAHITSHHTHASLMSAPNRFCCRHLLLFCLTARPLLYISITAWERAKKHPSPLKLKLDWRCLISFGGCWCCWEQLLHIRLADLTLLTLAHQQNMFEE